MLLFLGMNAAFAKCAFAPVQNGMCTGITCADGKCYVCCDAGNVPAPSPDPEPVTSCGAGYYLSGTSCVACPVGQYKSTTGNASSCQSCPSDDYGNAGTTAAKGAKSQSECYIASGTLFSTASGKGNYTGNCGY